jgi:hypothetical protein
MLASRPSFGGVAGLAGSVDDRPSLGPDFAGSVDGRFFAGLAGSADPPSPSGFFGTVEDFFDDLPRFGEVLAGNADPPRPSGFFGTTESFGAADVAIVEDLLSLGVDF